jgi:hypothetical protein
MPREDIKRIPLRQNVPWRIHDQIHTRTCYHVDAWLYQMPDDGLYFVIRTSAAGIHPIDKVILRATRTHGLTPVAWTDDVETRGLQRQIDSPWGKRHAPWLAALHEPIRAEAVTRRQGFIGPNSVRLWYVWTSPRLNDPTAGIENMYGVTKRGMADTTLPAPVPVARGRPKSPWDARTRSILRTLDKLLK